MPTADKYCEAIELYRTTDLTLGEISGRCGVTRSGLAAYIYRHHRDLLLKRNGLAGDIKNPIRKNKGQRPETREKYRNAIEACDSEKYIHLNISQIAYIFHLNPTALANQLRAHYPDIIPRRESERLKRGIADNLHRGVRKVSDEVYKEAVRLLRDSDYTIEEVAELCNVSYSGLRQHILFELFESLGMISLSNGHLVLKRSYDKYKEAIEAYMSSSETLKSIALRFGLNYKSFGSFIRRNIPEIIRK